MPKLASSLAPQLRTEYSVRNEIPFEELSSGSHRIVEWLCPNCGNFFLAAVRNRVLRGSGCNTTSCRGRRSAEINRKRSLAVHSLFDHEDARRFYFAELNGGLSPKEIAPNSHRKLNWRCAEGHIFERQVSSMVKSPSCTTCKNAHLVVGVNDLLTKAPKVAAELLSPYEPRVKATSKTYAHWVCEKCSKLWRTSFEARVRFHNGCPKCGTQSGIETRRENRLQQKNLSSYGELMKEWSPLNTADPKRLLPSSKFLALWDCSTCGKTWEKEVFLRTRKQSVACSNCSGSRLEAQFETLLQSLYSGEILRNKKPLTDSSGRKLELDFWLPKLHVAFEVQDFATHSKASDTEKPARVWAERSTFKKGPTYHELKRRLAKDQLDVALFDIWEDEISFPAELLKNLRKLLCKTVESLI